MSSSYARFDTSLAPFVRLVAFDLPKSYGLTLYGSWANGEYHVTDEDGCIRSYSDVDFVCYRTLRPKERTNIEGILYKTAATCGFKIKGVSIRPAHEISNMWSLPTSEHDQAKTQTEFIQFWTHIGTAEICAALLSSERCAISDHNRRYCINKFFLGIWRDLAIVSGHRAGSYLDTLRFAARRLPTEFCSASYALKLGDEMTISWEILQSAHQSAILKELSNLMQNSSEYEYIRQLITNVTLINSSAVDCWAAEMLDRARDLEANLAVRKAARARLSEKLKRGNA